MGNYQIRCRVSGGVTGTRVAILKQDGEELWFPTREAATTEANRLNREMNRPESCADFRYTVIGGDLDA